MASRSRTIAIASALLWGTAAMADDAKAAAQSRAAVATGAAERDARAAFVYQSRAVQNAAVEQLDEALARERQRVDDLTGKVKRLEQRLKAAGSAQREANQLRRELAQARAEASAAQERFADALGTRDREIGREIDRLRRSADEILATPDGLDYLERVNAGDFTAADWIEAKLLAARKRRRNIEEAADRRAFAVVNHDRLKKGQTTTADVIARFEEVTRLDPDNFSDWLSLSALYSAAGKDREAVHATEKARTLPTTVQDRISIDIVASGALMSSGDLAGARRFAESAVAAARDARRSDRSAYAETGYAAALGIMSVVLALEEGREGGLREAEEVLEVNRALKDRYPTNLFHLANFASSLSNVASKLFGKDPERAFRLLDEAVTQTDLLVAKQPAHVAYQVQAANLRATLGDAIFEQERMHALLLGLRELTAISTVLNREPKGSAAHEEARARLKEVSRPRFRADRLRQALAHYEEALTAHRRLAHSDPSSGYREHSVIGTLLQKGEALVALGDSAAARASFEEALLLARKAIASEGPSRWARGSIAEAKYALAGLPGSVIGWAEVVADYEALERDKLLLPDQRPRLEAARKHSGAQGAPSAPEPVSR